MADEELALPPIAAGGGTPRSTASGAESRSRPGSIDRPESEPPTSLGGDGEHSVGFGVGNADDAASLAHTMATGG